jgi:hypothetical protein
MVNEGCVGSIKFEGFSMRLKSTLAVVAAVVVLAATSQAPAEACCRRGPPAGWWGPAPVTHYIYTPNYYNVYYMATFAPDPYPLPYLPLGYWPRYERPYAAYGRRYWARRGWGGCCMARAYPVPAPYPVPVGRLK